MSETKRAEEREEMREGDAEDVPVDPSGRVVHVRRRAARIKALRDQYGESPEALAIADDLVDLACCASDEMERLVRAAEADIHDGYVGGALDVDALTGALEALWDNVGDLANSAVQARVRDALFRATSESPAEGGVEGGRGKLHRRDRGPHLRVQDPR